MRFTDEQVRRYSRQILLPEVGGHGQARLLAAEVALDVDEPTARIAALLLAAAGVGRLVLCGALDRVLDERDVWFPLARPDVGLTLGDAMSQHLARRNPDVTVARVAAAPPHLMRFDDPYPSCLRGHERLADTMRRAGEAASRVVHTIASGAVLPLVGPTAWAAVVDACEAAWPREACGWLEGAGPVATGVHRAAPGTGDAFAFSDDDLVALASAYAAGPPPRVLFHSHPRGPATLSAADEDALAPGGQVLHPLPHLVIAVRDGRAVEATLYRWEQGLPWVMAAVVRVEDRWLLRDVAR